MIVRIVALAGAAIALLLPATAFAYIGPGAGASLAGSLLAVLAAIGTAIGIVLFWPIRMLYKKLRGKKPAPSTAPSQTIDASESPSSGPAE